jgi:hypothetical protein
MKKKLPLTGLTFSFGFFLPPKAPIYEGAKIRKGEAATARQPSK